MHLDYTLAPNDSALDFGSVSLPAPDDSLCDDSPRSPSAVGLKLAPNPPYRLPSAPSSSDNDTPTTVPATPISQLPTTQMSIPNDIPSQGSPQLRSPTSSPASWPEVSTEVREMSPSIPTQSTPNMFPSGVSPMISHSSSAGTPPSVDSSPSSSVANNPTPLPLPLEDPLHLATPSSSFSALYPENDNDKDLIPSRQLKEPRISDFGGDESAQSYVCSSLLRHPSYYGHLLTQDLLPHLPNPLLLLLSLCLLMTLRLYYVNYWVIPLPLLIVWR